MNNRDDIKAFIEEVKNVMRGPEALVLVPLMGLDEVLAKVCGYLEDRLPKRFNEEERLFILDALVGWVNQVAKGETCLCGKCNRDAPAFTSPAAPGVN